MKKTTKKWAETDGVKIITAQKSRARLGIGEQAGIGYLLTAEEWEQVKKNILRLNITTQAEFARMAGVSRSMVSNLVKANKLVHCAGNGIDMENIDNLLWLIDHDYDHKLMFERLAEAGKKGAAAGLKLKNALEKLKAGK